MMINRLKEILKKYFPFLFFILIGVVFVSMGGGKYLDFQELHKAQDTLLAYVDSHTLNFVLIFIACYFCLVVALLPGVLVLDLIAGFALPQPYSTLLILVSAWFGATALFWASRHAFQDTLKNMGGKWIDRVRRGFKKYEDGYLIFLRLVPFFPYGLISIALGFVRISFVKYAWTTAIGIIPSAYLFSMAGTHLSALLAGKITPMDMISASTIGMFLLLSILVLSPVVLFRKKKVAVDDGDETN